jgi:selenocysteine lyase/cysteine desulfurase
MTRKTPAERKPAGVFSCRCQNRCVDVLGIDPMPGVLRFSMVHYDALDEVQRLTAALEEIA